MGGLVGWWVAGKSGNIANSAYAEAEYEAKLGNKILIHMYQHSVSCHCHSNSSGDSIQRI